MESLTVSEINIDFTILCNCVKKSLRKKELRILNWQLSPVKVRTQNFTTAGIYRVHGTAKVEKDALPWSLIIKIIKPEAEEKNNPNHFNYWKREALVYNTGLLIELPNVIQTPDCYMVEEKSATEIWLWMEEVKEDNSRIFSFEEYSFIANQIGLFHGCFTNGEYSLPNEEWICNNWLSSWVAGCDLYAANLSEFYSKTNGITTTIDTIMKRYLSLRRTEEKLLQQLCYLPRVVSHHDLSQQNMYISDKSSKLILIDWQYLGISGLGEDIGRMFGVAMSQGDIPLERAWEYQQILFDSYMEGLRETGWNGDSLVARYGFCLAVAFRSAWETPKLFKLLFQNKAETITDQIEKYTQIVLVQLKLAEEAVEIIEKNN